jgi:isoaspartyl peptidase/L-asparaginase-like protein (Ntn-hydrolase superfamily)
MCERITDPEI